VSYRFGLFPRPFSEGFGLVAVEATAIAQVANSAVASLTGGDEPAIRCE
jgi:hypothetical protein